MWARLLEEREEAPPVIGGRSVTYPCRPVPLSGSIASPLDICKETHFEAILCVSLWWFEVKFDPRTRRRRHWIDDVALE
jgi:hypothetical protein